MDRAAFEAAAPGKPSTTCITDASTFTISAVDIGTPAVRPGCMADIERDRDVLLKAAKLLLARIRARETNVGATYEAILEVAIRMAEAGKR